MGEIIGASRQQRAVQKDHTFLFGQPGGGKEPDSNLEHTLEILIALVVRFER
jgi:hypothetical protein